MQPNILIVMADQLTPFALGCYGNEIARTPNFDRLAAEGVTFDAAYCSSPLCTPARYAFMTGRNVSRIGGYDNSACLATTVPTFAHYLRAAGYATCLSGKMHFVGPDQLHGFEQRLTTDVYPAGFDWTPDWSLPPGERIDRWYHNMSSVKQAGVAAITNQLAYDDEVGHCAQRALYDFARSTDRRPWCLVASFIHPHDPYATRRAYWDLYEGVDVPLPRTPRPRAADADPHSLRLQQCIALDAVRIDEDEVRNARRAYLGNVSYVDAWLGRLRATLDECAFAENTVIVALSDHGDMLGERGLWYKMSFYEWSARIPLVIHAPRRFAPRRSSAPVAQVDLAPTLMELADCAGSGVEPLDRFDGRSLAPLCRGEDQDAQAHVVGEYLAEGAVAPLLMLRKGRYKYTCCPADPEQLFDLDADPDELDDLARAPRGRDVLEEFRALARAHWDVERVHREVLADQRRRRFLDSTLRRGRRVSWDHQPARDAAAEYTRDHVDLTRFDYESRWPRAVAFEPARS